MLSILMPLTLFNHCLHFLVDVISSSNEDEVTIYKPFWGRNGDLWYRSRVSILYLTNCGCIWMHKGDCLLWGSWFAALETCRFSKGFRLCEWDEAQSSLFQRLMCGNLCHLHYWNSWQSWIGNDVFWPLSLLTLDQIRWWQSSPWTKKLETLFVLTVLLSFSHYSHTNLLASWVFGRKRSWKQTFYYLYQKWWHILTKHVF